MKKNKVPYDKQIFVCTNDRKEENTSCGDQNGEAIFKELRRIAKERGLHPRIRVAQAKCLGQCARGGNIMVYPGDIWYQDVSLKNIEQLAEELFS